MKKLLIALIIFINGISIQLNAQSGNQKVDILQPVQHTSYVPAGVLMVNQGNKLRFESADASVQRFLVNASQGTVKQDGEDFIVTPEKTGDLSLAIYNYDDIGNPVLIEERNLTVVSGPVASIAGKSGGEIPKEEFLKAEKVLCSANFSITEFKLSTSGKGIGYHEFQGKGESLTSEMISAIQQLPVGSKIFVEYIRARRENSEATLQIAPLSFIIIK